MNFYEVTTQPPPKNAEDWYVRFYEYHAEQEQVAKAFGDETKETAHHWAALVLFRAMTAEQVPT